MLSVVDLGDRPSARGRRPRRHHPGRDPADVRRLPGARAHQDGHRGSACRVRPAGRGDGHLRGAMDDRADQRCRTSRPAGGRDRAADWRDRERARHAHRPRAARPVPPLRLAADHPRERLRSDPVPDHPLLRGLPPAVRSDQARLTVAEPRVEPVELIGVVGDRDDGRRDRPARARGRPRGRHPRRRPGRDRARSRSDPGRSRATGDAARSRSGYRRGVGGRPPLTPPRGGHAGRPDRRRPGPGHRGGARGPGREARDPARARCGDVVRGHPRDQHERPLGRGDRPRHRPAGTRARAAFLQPGPGHATRRGGRRAVHRSGRRRARDLG